MRQNVWQRMLLLCFAFTFAVLLISGAPRLIAVSPDDDADVSLSPSKVEAYLCGAPPDQNGLRTAQHDDNRPYQKADSILFHADMETPASDSLSADANGNVLRGTSYMRSVYQVFALGDGFA